MLSQEQIRDLQVEHYGRSVIKKRLLEGLPKNSAGGIEVFDLKDTAGDNLISQTEQFRRFVRSEIRLAEIRKELVSEGFQPWEPKPDESEL